MLANNVVELEIQMENGADYILYQVLSSCVWYLSTLEWFE